MGWRISRTSYNDDDTTTIFFDNKRQNSCLIEVREYNKDPFSRWEVRITLYVGHLQFPFGEIGDTRREAFENARKLLKSPWHIKRKWQNGKAYNFVSHSEAEATTQEEIDVLNKRDGIDKTTQFRGTYLKHHKVEGINSFSDDTIECMEDAMNESVVEYIKNKERFDRDYYLACQKRSVESNPHLKEFSKSPEWVALMDTIVDEKPFSQIMEELEELEIDELHMLVDQMPSGWERSKVMDQIDIVIEERY